MTTPRDDADLRELIHAAAPARVDPLDHARLQARGRRRRAARRASTATMGLGTIAALIVVAPLVLPSTTGPILRDGADHTDPNPVVAEDGPARELSSHCPYQLATSWACLPPGTRPVAPDLDLDVVDHAPAAATDLQSLRGRKVVRPSGPTGAGRASPSNLT